MRITCLQRDDAGDGKEVLASFLRTVGAVARYGRMTIYEGDVYYVPYSMVPYYIEETGETYVFIASEVSEDISVFKQDGRNQISLTELEAEDDYILDVVRVQEELLPEIEKKINMNRRMRKLFAKYHVTRAQERTVYLPEQTFYGRGRGDHLFLVDLLLQKVDFRNLCQVEERFARHYITSL